MYSCVIYYHERINMKQKSAKENAFDADCGEYRHMYPRILSQWITQVGLVLPASNCTNISDVLFVREARETHHPGI